MRSKIITLQILSIVVQSLMFEMCSNCKFTCTMVQLSKFFDYFRWYKVDEKDAMGQKNVHRGFSDPNLFVAQVIMVKPV